MIKENGNFWTGKIVGVTGIENCMFLTFFRHAPNEPTSAGKLHEHPKSRSKILTKFST